jgi:hypothetical protein
MHKNIKSKDQEFDRRDLLFWRAYLEILDERVPLVESWPDGANTWHPRVGEKMLWYSDIPNTLENRKMVYAWLMEHAIEELPRDDQAVPTQNSAL